MSNRIPSSPVLQWSFTDRGWATVLNGRILNLVRKGEDVWWLLVDGNKVASVKSFCDGAQIASVLPQFRWNASLAQTHEIAARMRLGQPSLRS